MTDHGDATERRRTEDHRATDADTSAPIDVLVVDDDHWTCASLAASFSDSDRFRVLPPVYSGQAAVESYREQRPDIVLMDLNMPPGKSGIDATEEILAHDPTARILILTTIAPGPGIARALSVGALAAVSKALPPAELHTAVELAAREESPTLLRGLATDLAISGITTAHPDLAVPQISQREVEVLTLICRGRSYQEIAEELTLTVATVKTHARHLRTKLDATSLAMLVVRALEFKFVHPE